METVHKSTTTLAVEQNEFVLSDETRDRFGDVVEAAGWDLRHFRKNPIALFGHDARSPIGTWRDVRIEGKRLLGRLEFAAAGTSARIDELRALVEQRILKAVSVGFRVLKAPEQIEGGGFRFTKHELLETSLVAVPANPAALATAKAMGISDVTLKAIFGVPAVTGSHGPELGVPAAPSRIRTGTMKTLAQRIEDAQQELNDARDKLTAYMKDEDSPDDVVVEEMSTTIEQREARLGSLRRAEKALAASTVTAPAATDVVIAAPHVRRPLGIQVKEPKPADLIIRAALCHLVGHVLNKDPLQILEERYGDHEATQIVTRASIAGAMTTVAGWAQELVETATTDFLEVLRPVSVFPRLAALGQSLSFGPGRGNLKIPSRAATPSISGSFVGEGAPIPVRRIGLTSIPLLPHKLGVISVFTREMARYSNPQIEALLRREIVADTALTIDTLLFDAVAGSAIRPAGLRNGVAAISASAAGGYAAILADLNALLAPFDASNSSGRVALVMNPAQARTISMTPGPAGTFGWATQFLTEGNLSVIASTTVPAGDVHAIGVDDFVAVNGAPEFDVSEQTVLHMEDTTPLQIGTAGSPATVAAPAQSMFQTASIALRMLMDTTWAMRRTGQFHWIDNVDWAP